MNPSPRHLVASLLCVFAATFAVAACGSDDDATTAGNGSGDDGNTTGGGSKADGGSTNPDSTPGCGAAGVKTGFVGSQSLTVDGEAHTYELFVPDAYDGKKSYPVVFVFHGDGGTGANIRSGFKIEATAAGEAIVVYPDGPGKTWQIDSLAKMTKDIAFIDAVAADLAKTHCLDANRVYATGFSKGAYFVNQLACRSKTKWAAVATHAGGGPFGTDASEFENGDLKCSSGALPALQVQGLDDGTVSPDEGEKARDHWRATNGCKDSTTSYDPSPCVSYEGCTKPEVWCAIPGMGHSIWENAAKVTWGFFGN